jgi:hypothetical protein
MVAAVVLYLLAPVMLGTAPRWVLPVAKQAYARALVPTQQLVILERPEMSACIPPHRETSLLLVMWVQVVLSAFTLELPEPRLVVLVARLVLLLSKPEPPRLVLARQVVLPERLQ